MISKETFEHVRYKSPGTPKYPMKRDCFGYDPDNPHTCRALMQPLCECRECHFYKPLEQYIKETDLEGLYG